MNTDRSIFLSTRSTIALTRCSTLHGSILTRFTRTFGCGLGRTADSAAQNTARHDQVAAHAKPVGEQHAKTGLISPTAPQAFPHQNE